MWRLSNGKTNKGESSKGECDLYLTLFKALQVDLMGSTRTESLGGKRYIMVIVDDFSRYIWVQFPREKSEACEKMENLCKRLQNEKGVPIVKIRSLRMQDLSPFVRRMGSRKNFQLLKLLNKLGWLRGRIG